MAKKPKSAETLAVHGMGDSFAPAYDLVPPIHPASTFERSAKGDYPGGHLYSRLSSPAYDQAESLLCELEKGEAALLFSSGMAAGTTVLQALNTGDRVLAPRSMYWGLRNWMISFAQSWGIDLAFYENSSLDELAQLLKGKPTRLLWIESPANPTWEITDIRRAAGLAHEAGATVVVDSTIGSPVLINPLELGADIVMHSATKYLNGHSDVVAGALIAKRADDFWKRIHFVRGHGGAVLGPFESWLLLRGMRTLFVRVRTASANAQKLAEALHPHPAVLAVLYPGLPSHPGHAIAKAQMKGGFGATLSIRIKGGEVRAREVAARVEIFKRATSLGSVESLIEHRASIEGPGTLAPDDLLRISVGIEPAEDLIADLFQALDF